MKIEEYIIEKDCVLRDWLKSRFSYRRITSLKRNGGITIENTPVRADQKVFEGQKIRLEFVEERNTIFPPRDLGLKVVYMDEDLTVIKKGRGVTSMPTVAHPDDSILNGMKFLYPDKTFRVVTRLDKDTEGLVLLANNSLSHSRIKDVKKYYVAVVKGCVKEPLKIDAPITKGFGIERVIGGDVKCLSLLTPLYSGKNYSLVMLQPITGRTHQLRVHCAYVGHSIAGDTLYGEGEGEYNSGQMLACIGLDFSHPSNTGQIKIFCEELKNEYLAFVKGLNKE